MSHPEKKFFIIDGHSYGFQAFYAIGSLQTPSGTPVGAVFGFTQLIEKLLAERPTHLAVVFDSAAATFRSQAYGDYKIHRAPMPEDLSRQMDMIREVLGAYRIPALELPGYEADDLIATIAKRASGEGIPTFIISKDKDLDQLIDEHIRIYDPKDGTILDAAGLLEKKGLRPDQVIDFLSLVGDSSDNVPGVEGIGPKTALKVLAAVQSLEEAFTQEIPGLSPRLQEKLRGGRDAAFLSKSLVTLVTKSPVPGGAEPACFLRVEPDREALKEHFRRFNFLRLLEKYSKESWAAGTAAGGALSDSSAAAPAPGGGSAAMAGAALEAPGPVRSSISISISTSTSTPAPAPQPLHEPLPSTYSLVRTREDLEALARRLRAAEAFAVDTETSGLDPFQDGLVGLSFAVFAPGAGDPPMPSGAGARQCRVDAFYVPLRSPEELLLSKEGIFQALQPLLEDPTRLKIGQNIKFDTIFYRRAGIHLEGLAFDTMIAAYLLNPERRSNNLDSLALEYLGHGKIPIESLLGEGKSRIGMEQVPLEKIRDYSCEDADVTLRLWPVLKLLLAEAGLEKLLDEVEMPLVEVLAEMEMAGIAIDPAQLASMAREIRASLEAITSTVHSLAACAFNIASPQQLAEVLYTKLGLPPGPKGKSGVPSTAADVLQGLKDRHPIVTKILEHRELTKLLGTYVEALPALVRPATGRIHTSFNQTVTATGRLSSSDPNLQNIPIKTEIGRKIRKAFKAGSPDQVLLSADYSQVELRILAHLSLDEALLEAFRREEDIHRSVAAQLYGVGPEDVTAAMRRFAKVVNFGIIYGMTAYGLSQDLGIAVEEAARIIQDYFDRHRGVKAFVDGAIAQARETGHVRTILGRRRPIRDISSKNQRLRAFAERTAVNSIVQGSAADLIKVAMNNLHTDLLERGSRARLLLQIHDELVLELPREDLAVEEARVREEMVGAMALKVPLVVNTVAGETWYKE